MDKQTRAFPDINNAYKNTFQPEQLSIGLVVPLEANKHEAIPSLDRHIERAKMADKLSVATSFHQKL